MNQLARRKFLTGVGTAIAVPLLDRLAPDVAAAQGVKAAAKAVPPVPNRMLFMYVPNGCHMQDWRPASLGDQWELPYILQPLQNVKEHITVLSGLTADKARPNGDGPGDHARALAAILTGAQPRKTNGADIRVGVSVDQFAAQRIGKATRFPSLELGIDRGGQSGNCDSGYSCAYSANLSWSSETTPVAKEIDPHLLFERLFGNSRQDEMDESRARREKYRKSILDFVRDDARTLSSQLGQTDRHKLEEYLTGIREIERRLVGVEKRERPIVDETFSQPAGIPAQFGEHIDLMLDLLVLALQSDLTRIGTFMFANEGSNRSYSFAGIPEGHHDLSHHGGDPVKHDKIRNINRFHMTHFARMLEKMKGVKEGEGTLLDHVMICYASGIGDGNRHNHDNLPVLLAGKGCGTIKPNRHVAYPFNTPINNLYLSLLERMNVACDKLGDSTATLDGLA